MSLYGAENMRTLPPLALRPFAPAPPPLPSAWASARAFARAATFFTRSTSRAFCVSCLAAGAAACSTSSAPSGSTSSAPGDDAGPAPSNQGQCKGDAARCAHGTLAARGFTVGYASAKVQLFDVFPYGRTTPIAESPVAADGHWAFDGLDATGRYYVQGVARFSGSAGSFAIASVVGPVTVPLGAAVDVQVRPVFLEALQQRPAGGALALSWASAHVYDPGSGKELTDAKVTLRAGSTTANMPYGANLSGQESYFVELGANAPAPSAIAIDVSHPTFAGGATYQLAPETPDFDPTVTAPPEKAQIAVGQPLSVSWTAEPRAAYAVVQLFVPAAGGGYTAKYASDAPRAPTVTTEIIPATAIDAAGPYLLNVQMARPSCPTTADGCVYNASTAAVDLTAK